MVTKTKKYDFSNKPLDYGFVYLNRKQSKISLSSVLSSAKESVIFADTENRFFEDSLGEFEFLFNQETKLIIGLLSKATLNSIKNRGVKTGFYRSTELKINLGIIIVDKKYVYTVVDSNHIYQMVTKAEEEIFALINHILWSKTNFEFCQNELRTVKSTRLSVIMPSFETAVKNPSNKVMMATQDSGLECDFLLISKQSDLNRDAKIISNDLTAYSKDGKIMAFDIFEKNFYEFDSSDDSLFIANSFRESFVGQLVGKDVWVKGVQYHVLETDNISFDVKVPLDEVEMFVPDFDSEAQKYTKLTKELVLNCNVYPLKLDGSYALSNRYKTIQRVENELKESIAKLEKMDLDKKLLKQLESIKSERLLSEKVKMFNAFVASKEFGVDALNNKKSPVSIISVNEDELNVPNELIGKLYTKQSKNYLATTKDRIDDAKKWLKENKMEAVLIEA